MLSITLLIREKFANAIHPAFGARVVLVAALLGERVEFADHFTLTVGEIDRRLDDHVTEKIAVYRCAQGFNPFAA